MNHGENTNSGSRTNKWCPAWTGGSLQTTLNSSFTGGLSLQLAPSAIIASSISGIKYKDLDKDGTRDSRESSAVTDANGALIALKRKAISN